MTDNITPQAQAKAPMTTEDIIRRLGGIRAVYPMALGNAIGEEETAAGMEALTLAIQAVELLEEIRQELRGECCACEHVRVKSNEEPCRNCSAGNGFWKFRWPLGELGEEADQ